MKSIILDCSNGDVRLEEVDDIRIPMIFWNGQWSRICGHHFWDDNIGATLFCKKLNYDGGTIFQSGYWSAEPGFWVGQCFYDDVFPYCNGKCSKMFRQIGGKCVTGILGDGPICDIMHHRLAAVKCYGPNGMSSSC